MKSTEEASDDLDDQIAIYNDMIEEIVQNNHFEANPEVLVELEREYGKLVGKKNSYGFLAIRKPR